MTYFVAQIILTLVTGSSHSWLLCPFDIDPQHMFGCFFVFLFSIFLFFGIVKCSGFILCISCLRPRLNDFSNNPWLFLLENSIRNGLSARYVHCCWSLVSSSPDSWLSKDVYVYMVTHLHIQIYKYYYTLTIFTFS